MNNRYKNISVNKPIFQDIEKAASVLNGNLFPTPLIRSDVIDIITQKKSGLNLNVFKKVAHLNIGGI